LYEKINAIFPEEEDKQLHAVVGPCKIKARTKEVVDLKAAYELAEKDPVPQEVIKGWKVFDEKS
jgi:hypothetical protein